MVILFVVNKQLDPENHQFPMETSLSTPICQGRTVNLPEGTFCGNGLCHEIAWYNFNTHWFYQGTCSEFSKTQFTSGLCRQDWNPTSQPPEIWASGTLFYDPPMKYRYPLSPRVMSCYIYRSITGWGFGTLFFPLSWEFHPNWRSLHHSEG